MFKADEEVWRRYHNNMCPLSDVIREKLPSDLEKIFLLPELWDKESRLNSVAVFFEQIHHQKVRFGIDNSIYIKTLPPGRTYRLNITYPQSKASIDYEMVVRGVSKGSETVIFSFEKRNFFINGKEADMIMDEIALLATKGIYPIELMINYLKRDIEILNLEERLKFWHESRKRIEKEYIGKIVQNYLDRTEACFSDNEKFVYSLINNDIFFSLFTHQIYGPYFESLRFNTEIRLSLGAHNSTLTFEGEQWIEPEYNNMSGVYVYFKGYATGIDMTDKTTAEYELNIEYNLQYKTFSIKDVIAEINLLKDNTKKAIMKTTIYQLRREEIVKDE